MGLADRGLSADSGAMHAVERAQKARLLLLDDIGAEKSPGSGSATRFTKSWTTGPRTGRPP